MSQIIVKPNSKAQEQILDLTGNEGYNEVLITSGVGSGKTYIGLISLMRWLAYPRTEAFICRYRAIDAWRSTMRTLLIGDLITPPVVPPHFVLKASAQGGIVILKNGSVIKVIGLNDPAKLGSMNGSVGLVDEAYEVDEEALDSLSRRIRVPHPLGNLLMLPTNPATQRHYLYKRFLGVDPLRARRRVIRLNTVDNAKNLGDNYIERLKNQPEHTRRRMLEGEWFNNEGTVFWAVGLRSEWYENDGSRCYFVSQDYGGGSGQAAMLLWSIDGNGDLFVEAEWGGNKLSHFDVLEQLRYWRSKRVVYDPANAALKIDMERAGFETIKPNKAIEPGIAACNGALSSGKVRINPKCEKLINDLYSAQYTPLGSIDKRTGWDYLDAFRYGVMSAPVSQSVVVALSRFNKDDD